MIHSALRNLREEGISVAGKKCMVIGNGMMGRISAQALMDAGADVTVTVRPGDRENVYKKFAVWFGQNEQYHTAISYRPYGSVLKIDRKFSGSRRAVIHQRRCLVPDRGGELTFRMILDRCSVEIFVNDGEQTLTATMFTDLAADGFRFFADGKVVMDVDKYDLDV